MDQRGPDSGEGAGITALPASVAGRDLVLFGGTFDPPHRAHIELGCAACAHVGDHAGGRSAALVFVPAGRSPHKDAGPRASGADRAAMIDAGMREAGCAGVGAWGVWMDEVDRAGPNYWVDTLRRAARVGPRSTRMWFVVGLDQALALHRWREPHEILRLARPVVLARPCAGLPVGPGGRVDAGSRAWFAARIAAVGAWNDAERALWAGALVEGHVLMDHAATDVRGLVAGGAGDDALRAHLHDAVIALIRARGLYGARGG